MTWHFDPSGTTMDVYDHEGTLVATDREFGGTWSTPPGYPREVLVVMEETFDNGSQSKYNQDLLRDAATQNIQVGTP